MFRELVVLALAVLSAVVALVNATEPIDLRVLDQQFKLLRAWFPRPAPEIAIIGIDDASMESIAEPLALWHGHFGKILSALSAVEPVAVGIDIVLPDRSFESIARDTDALLIKGLLDGRRSYPLVLALTIDPGGATRKVHPPFLGVAGPGAAGYALFPLDHDGVIRRFDERIAVSGDSVPTFVGQLARKLGKTVVSGYIDYSRGDPFRYIGVSRVLDWIERNDTQALSSAFRGKPVLLGVIDRFNDRRPTPVQLSALEVEATDTSGVLINAQALRNVLEGGFVQRAQQTWIAVCAVIAACAWFISSRAMAVALLAILFSAALLGVSTWMLARGWFVPVASIIFAACLGLVARHAWDTAERLIERRRLRTAFGGYVSPSVMNEILAGHIEPALGGVVKFVCILFSDIRGYTTRSEGMSAPEVVVFLNRYFDRVVDCIHAHDGAVFCFMGDGIMAAFGAAKPLPNPCQSAYDAARDLVENVVALNREICAEGEKPIDIGIGLHAGMAVVGHIGSRDRHDFTAVGDVTNVASRLESVTKEAGYQIVVSSEVVRMVKHDPALVDLGCVEIRGHSPMQAYGRGAVTGKPRAASSPA